MSEEPDAQQSAANPPRPEGASGGKPSGAPGVAPGGHAPPSGPYPQPGPPGFGPPGYGPPPTYGPPGHWAPQGYAAPAAPAQVSPSPLSGLLDLGFTRRITPELAKIVHLVLIAVAVVVTVLGIITAVGMFATAGDRFIGGPSWVVSGLVVLVLSPLASFLAVAFGRFVLEAFLDQAARRREDPAR